MRYEAILHCWIPISERNYIVITQKEGDDITTLGIILCMSTGTTLKPNLGYVIFDSEFSEIAKATHQNIKSKCDELLGDNLLKYESWAVGKLSPKETNNYNILVQIELIYYLIIR